MASGSLAGNRAGVDIQTDTCTLEHSWNLRDFKIAPIHNGAEVSVAVVNTGGALAYGPSAPMTVTVGERMRKWRKSLPLASQARCPMLTPRRIPVRPLRGVSTPAHPLSHRGDFLEVDLGSEHAGANGLPSITTITPKHATTSMTV